MNIKEIATTLAACVMVMTQTAGASAEVKKVSGNYTYYGDKNDSPAMSKRKALEGARLDAISREFGTIVSQDVMQADRVDSNGESTKFLSLSATEVKGEWIADEGEPKYVVSLGNDDCLIVNCRITGTAKSANNDAVDFEALALRNGTTKGNASTEYKEKDNLYLSFTAPVDGYVQVYLMGEDNRVSKMLPYQQNPDGEVKVKKGYDYVFFDDSRALGGFGEPDAFEIQTKGEIEFNKLYVLFSPNAFSLPVMHPAPDELSLPYLTDVEFSKWLVKVRRNDPKMGVKQINLKLLPL